MSTTSTSTSASTSAPARSNASVPTPTAAPTRSRPCSSLVENGNSIRFWMSLTVIRPWSRPSASTTGSFSILCRCRIAFASSRVVPTGAVTRSRAVISAETGWPVFDSKRRSRLVRMPTSTPVVVGDRHARNPVALHQFERVGDRVTRTERDGLDDHPRLGALDLVDLGDLVGDRKIAVQDADPALAGQGDREARLGDGVHRRGHDRDLERDRPGQACRRAHVVRQHGRLGGHEQDVIEGEALTAELLVERKLLPFQGRQGNTRLGRLQRILGREAASLRSSRDEHPLPRMLILR